MADVENHTLTLLREIRADIAKAHEVARADLQAFREEVSGRFDRLEKRVDVMHGNGLKALKGFIGHRTMVERTMASFEIDMTELKRQMAELEGRAG